MKREELQESHNKLRDDRYIVYLYSSIKLCYVQFVSYIPTPKIELIWTYVQKVWDLVVPVKFARVHGFYVQAWGYLVSHFGHFLGKCPWPAASPVCTYIPSYPSPLFLSSLNSCRAGYERRMEALDMDIRLAVLVTYVLHNMCLRTDLWVVRQPLPSLRSHFSYYRW